MGTLAELFWVFLKIGTFTLGGGLAILSLIRHEVEANGWMSQAEFVDIVAISQVTPGPIGINCATYVGYTATGSVLGSVLATFAIILPSLVIMLSICKLYFWLSTRFQHNPYFQNTLRMLRLVVLGLIAAAALILITPASFVDGRSWVFFGVVFLLTVLPEIVKLLPVAPSSAVKKAVGIVSHPIFLILY